jgi:acetyl esterase
MTAEPHTRALLDQMAQNPPPPLTVETLPALRQALVDAMLQLDRPAVDGTTERELSIEGPNGPVPVTAVRPEGTEPLPIAVYFHGGGFSRGNRAGYAMSCRYYAKTANALVLNVEYRLAPEHPFPQGLQDAYAVVRWAASKGAEIGGDPTRLVVFGDSAGGNFSAAIALKAKAEDIPLRGQGLLYPGVDMRLAANDIYPSRQRWGGGEYFLDLERMNWYAEQYLPTPDEAENPLVSPILAPSHAGLAPALVLTAELDPLCDEGAAYAEKLKAAGVETEYACYEGTVHAFLSFAKAIPLALEGQSHIARWLKDRLHA